MCACLYVYIAHTQGGGQRVIPVDQTITGFKKGNCFQACIASIFEVEINQIPGFMGKGIKNFDSVLEKWLKEMGLLMPAWYVDGEEDFLEKQQEYFPDTYMVVMGKSPRAKKNEWHCVVYHDGKMVHDPHPADKRGLDKVEAFRVFLLKNPGGVVFNARLDNSRRELARQVGGLP
jgi:hypothetical protein